MSQNNQLIKYIESKDWGGFSTRAAHLLVRTMQLKGTEMMKRKMRFRMYFEDLSVCHSHQEQLRVSSLESFFSQQGIIYFRDHPDVVLDYMIKCEDLIKITREEICGFDKLLKQGYEEGLIRFICKIVDFLAMIGHWKYYITAIFIRTFSRFRDDSAQMMTKRFGQWKNNEENYNFEEDFLIRAAHIMVRRRKLPIQGIDFARYIDIDEFLDWLNLKLTDETILSIIKRRKTDGYVQINLSDQIPHSRVLEGGTREAQAVKHYVYNLRATAIAASKDLRGKVAFMNQPLVSGECAVITAHGKSLRKTDLENKILVTSMITPEFIPYIKKVKGIITDTGSLICHAAIMAREFCIPCIVGAINATKNLHTGDRIEMDMETGTVRNIK